MRGGYYAGLYLRQTIIITVSSIHMWALRLSLTVVRLSVGLARPLVYFYKPYSATADWTQLAFTARIITLTPTDSKINEKGGSMTGPMLSRSTKNTSHMKTKSVLLLRARIYQELVCALQVSCQIPTQQFGLLVQWGT